MINFWVNFSEELICLEGLEAIKFKPFDNNLVFFDEEDNGDYEWVFDGGLLEDIESPSKDDLFLYSSGSLECEESFAEFNFYTYQKYSDPESIIIILKNEDQKYTILKNENFKEN